MNTHQKIMKIQENMQEVEKMVREVYGEVQREDGKAVQQWEYLQERRMRHAKEMAVGFADAYGAVNAMLNVDGFHAVDVKKKGQL